MHRSTGSLPTGIQARHNLILSIHMLQHLQEYFRWGFKKRLCFPSILPTPDIEKVKTASSLFHSLVYPQFSFCSWTLGVCYKQVKDGRGSSESQSPPDLRNVAGDGTLKGREKTEDHLWTGVVIPTLCPDRSSKQDQLISICELLITQVSIVYIDHLFIRSPISDYLEKQL